MADLPDLGVPYRFEPAASDDDTDELTVVALHGAGGTEHSLIDAARRLVPGAAILCPRGTIDDGDGYRHLPRRPPPEEEQNLDPDLPTPWQVAVHERTKELLTFLEAASAALHLDGERLCLFGFSDGATAAAALALDHPTAIDGAVILSGKPPFRPTGGRILDRKQVFCATGRNDDLATMDDYEELVEALVTAGADVELHWYDAGHEIPEQALEDAAAWARKWLVGPSVEES